MATPGVKSAQALVALPPDAAFTAAITQLSMARYPVTWQMRPTSARFEFDYSNFWHTSGMKVRYEGSFSIAPVGPNQSQVQVELAPVSSSLTSLYVGFGVGGAILACVTAVVSGWGWIGLFMTLAATAASIYFSYVRFTDTTPTEEAKKLVARICAGQAPPLPGAEAQPFQSPPPQQDPPPRTYSPPPPPPPPPQPQSGGPAASSDVLVEQLRKLTQLKDAGLLNQSEFDAKKADLINKILGG